MRENLHKKKVRRTSAKRTLALIFVVGASLPNGVCTAVTVIPITPEPVGSGARALGQSAFVAVADDATAASWNPAGLINLERPEVSFVGAWRSVKKDYSATSPLISIDPESWSDSELNFMSYAQPLEVGNTDVVLSVNYHQVYDFGVEFNSHSIVPETSLGQVIGQRVTEEEGWSEGAVSAYTLAGGLSVPDYPKITLGAGINWYTQSILNDRAWRIGRTTTVTTHWNSGGQDVFRSNHEETFDDFRAYNFTLGLLLDAHEKQENLLTFGLVYHTPFTARVDWEFISDSQPDPLRDETMDIDFPASFGAGVNYRFSDALSAAFDVEWKEWSKFRQKYANGTQTSPVDDDALAYRLGCEHLFLEDSAESVFACRGGAFYEPRPITSYPDLVPVYGLSAGLGWTLMDQFSLDFAYQHRWGQEDLGNMEYKIKEDFFVLSVIKYF